MAPLKGEDVHDVHQLIEVCSVSDSVIVDFSSASRPSPLTYRAHRKNGVSKS
jgi:hypothetical protein